MSNFLMFKFFLHLAPISGLPDPLVQDFKIKITKLFSPGLETIVGTQL